MAGGVEVVGVRFIRKQRAKSFARPIYDLRLMIDDWGKIPGGVCRQAPIVIRKS
jgi:hypothetical protein